MRESTIPWHTAILLVSLWVVYFVTGNPLAHGISGGQAAGGAFWNSLHYAFFHESLWHIRFNSIIILIVFPNVEKKLGNKLIPAFWGAATIAGVAIIAFYSLFSPNWMTDFASAPFVGASLGITFLWGMSLAWANETERPTLIFQTVMLALVMDLLGHTVSHDIGRTAMKSLGHLCAIMLGFLFAFPYYGVTPSKTATEPQAFRDTSIADLYAHSERYHPK